MQRPSGPPTLGYACVQFVARHIDDPAVVPSLAHVPVELVELILYSVMQLGKLQSIATLELFMECGHPSVVDILKRQDIGSFQSRCFGVGLTPKVHHC